MLRVNVGKPLTYPEGRFFKGCVGIETCIEASKLFIENINVSSLGSRIDFTLKIKPICKRDESRRTCIALGSQPESPRLHLLPETLRPQSFSLLQFVPVHPLMRLAAKLSSRRMKRLPHPVCACFLPPEHYSLL